MDDSLTFNKKRVIELCDMILREGLRFRWNTPNGIAADSLDEELAKIMKKAGCVNVGIGIESGNETVRNKIIKKGLSNEIIYRSLSACRKAKLPVVGFFILGIPGENADSFEDTIKLVKKLPLSMIATSFYTPFPGTKLYEECVSNGYIDKEYWRNIYKFNAPVVKTTDFDIKKLREWKKKIYLEFVKAHFWDLFFTTITFRNEFIKLGQIRRFLKEKFGV